MSLGWRENKWLQSDNHPALSVLLSPSWGTWLWVLIPSVVDYLFQNLIPYLWSANTSGLFPLHVIAFPNIDSASHSWYGFLLECWTLWTCLPTLPSSLLPCPLSRLPTTHCHSLPHRETLPTELALISLSACLQTRHFHRPCLCLNMLREM